MFKGNTSAMGIGEDDAEYGLEESFCCQGDMLAPIETMTRPTANEIRDIQLTYNRFLP